MAGSPWTAAGAATLLMLLAQAAAWALQQPSGAAPQLSLPAQLPGGWAVSNEPLTAWTPRFQNPSAVATLTYRRPDGSAVAVWVGHYRDQGQERKLVTSTNVMVEYKSVDWLAVPTAARPVRTGVDGAAMVQMRSTVLRTPADPKTTPRQRLLVMQVYRVGDRFITEDALAHLHIALRRLLGRGDDGAVLMFYAETDEAGHGDAVLQSFVADHLAAIAAPVDAASRQR